MLQKLCKISYQGCGLPMTAVLKYKHTSTACVSQSKLEWAAHLEKISYHPSDVHTDFGNHSSKKEREDYVIVHALPND